jgi:hypothetical protein
LISDINHHVLAKILIRDKVTESLRRMDPVALLWRAPGARDRPRVPLTALGPHQQWSIDGHDKLTGLGLPIYGIRDKWSGYVLSLKIVPNNRMMDTVALLFIDTVKDFGGIPHTVTSDKGKEVSRVYTIQSALR